MPTPRSKSEKARTRQVRRANDRKNTAEAELRRYRKKIRELRERLETLKARARLSIDKDGGGVYVSGVLDGLELAGEALGARFPNEDPKA